MDRWIMHLDMDAFYAAVEQRDDPRLRGRPVIVGAMPGGRGVVATCSYEARRFGIRSAMPINEAYRRCPHAVYLRPRMPHYVAVSRIVRATLAELFPVIEPVSIDEAFVDLAGLERLLGAPHCIGRRAKQAIENAVRLTASVGIGPNRLIAKLASEHRKPNGLTVVPTDRVQAFLDPQPVSVLRGVGRQTLPRLTRLGVRTVADLRARPLGDLEVALGPRLALALFRQAQGSASAEVRSEVARKSISKETTFEQDQTADARLHEALRELAAGVARTARSEGVAGWVVTLKIRYTGFETHTRRRRLDQPTASERVLVAEALALLRPGAGRSPLPERPVRLIGVGLADLTAPTPQQRDLFDPVTDDGRSQRLEAALDAVNGRFGIGTLGFGLGTRPKRKPSR